MQYHCIDCDKTIVRRPSNPPVNPIRETNIEYYNRMVANGRAAYVIYPAFGTENRPAASHK